MSELPIATKSAKATEVRIIYRGAEHIEERVFLSRNTPNSANSRASAMK
jgi:hypothetical protein